MIREKKIISTTTDLSPRGGGENLLIDLFGLMKNNNWRSYVSSLKEFDSEISKHYSFSRSEYVKFSLRNIFFFRNSTVLSHHRKVTTFLVILNSVLRLKCRIIHISTSEFKTLKYFSVFPAEIIAVSEKVRRNCIEYFKIKNEHITLIYNGVDDRFEEYKTTKSEITKILYVARIDDKKQQFEIIKHCKGKLNNVKILFIGSGPRLNELQDLTKDSSEFEALGYCNDIKQYVRESDYFMLMSKQEGLPLSLIESCMYGRPAICNDVGGTTEIIFNNYNGFIFNDFHNLAEELNKLAVISEDNYIQMSRNARKTYEENFTFGRMTQQYLDYLN